MCWKRPPGSQVGDPWGRGLVVQIGVLSRNWQLPTLHGSAFVGRKIHAFCHMCPQSTPPTHRQAAQASHGEGPAANKPNPRQTKHFTSTLAHSLRRRVVIRPAYLRLWPALSFFPFGLLFLAWMAITAGVRLRSSTGMTDSPSPGKGVGRTGRENKHTS